MKGRERLEDFVEQIKRQAEINQIMLNDKQAESFYQYMNLLLEWNKKMNLTAITQKEDIILKHFVDSITVLPYIEENSKIIDVGTGAGFPGIPIKIMRADTEILLLDSLNKRVQFLDEVIRQMNLGTIKAIHARAEELAKDKGKRETFDIATSRAVAKLNVLLEYMLPFVKVGGKCICMKAHNIEEELKESQKAIEVLGGDIEKIGEVRLGKDEMVRKIVIIKKIKATPIGFPRKSGIPNKKPIQ